MSVAVHADASGKPGAKLFDLVSPTEFGAGHSFFEAPRGKTLEASTSYVMVWSHLGGTVAQDAEDLEQQRGLGRAAGLQHGERVLSGRRP